MLTSIELENFRGFKSTRISNLERVNLIAGKNNTGKTALLEGLLLLFQPQDSQAMGVFRPAFNQSQVVYFDWLINRQAQGQPTSVTASFDDSTRIVWTTQMSLPGFKGARRAAGGVGGAQWQLVSSPERGVEIPPIAFTTRPTSPSADARDYDGVAVLRAGEEAMESLMRAVDPRVNRIRALRPGNFSEAQIHVDIGLPEMIPVTQMGQGFNRLLAIYSAIVRSKGRLLLIDEIENGLHHSILPMVWEGLENVARQYEVQIFATTHSWECVMAAHETFAKSDHYDLAVHRLERTDKEIRAVTYDRESLGAAEELAFEVR